MMRPPLSDRIGACCAVLVVLVPLALVVDHFGGRVVAFLWAFILASAWRRGGA